MTPHFSNAEVVCKCGCGLLPEQSFMNRVENLRVRYGRPMKVTSGARCPDYNAKVSSTGRTGPHTTRRAIDIGVSRLEAWILLRLALQEGFTGIGVNQKGEARFIHLDDVHNPATVWSYP